MKRHIPKERTLSSSVGQPITSNSQWPTTSNFNNIFAGNQKGSIILKQSELDGFRVGHSRDNTATYDLSHEVFSGPRITDARAAKKSMPMKMLKTIDSEQSEYGAKREITE